jgi:hypothetical protein
LAASAWSLREIDAGRPVGRRAAFRHTFDRLGPLAASTGVVVALVVLLSTTIVTLPFAVILLVRRMFALQAVMVEDLPARAALRRSRELVTGRWWSTAVLVALVAGLGALTGPVVGVGLLFVTTASFTFVNAVASVVYAITIPYVALALAYLYGDLRARSAAASPD